VSDVNDDPSEVIAGIDGSANAVRAACWAAAVAGRLGAPLRLIHARPDIGPNLTEAAAAFRAVAMTYHAENADRFLKEAEAAVHVAHPELTVSTTATSEAVDGALITASADARLIVLGSIDLSPAVAVLLGSTTLRVTSNARCPVIVWRGTEIQPSKAPIVVGLDESPSAAVALDVAFDLAACFDAPVNVVHSWTMVSLPGEVRGFPDWEEVNAATRTRIEAIVANAERHHPGLKVTTSWESPGASRALLDHVGNAQLVAVGNRGRSALTAAVMGSTSLNLLHHSRIPVMVCHDDPPGFDTSRSN
jgi:nucleotide-binding universal stress UspA family protein